MSDLHRMPLVGHDPSFVPVVRARVYKIWGGGWGWSFFRPSGPGVPWHGPFPTWREAYDSARRMCEQL